jgi:chromate reductase
MMDSSYLCASSALTTEATMAYHIAVVVGSLRRESFNRQLAQAVISLAPADFTFEFIDIGSLPLYSQEYDANYPEAGKILKQRVEAANALLFVTPEYNRSIPGVLKNAIDVASRPYGKSSFLGKPVGIVSNSPGPLGGVSAAKHLQNILPGISGPILGQPETYLNAVGDAFDDKGECTKESLKTVLEQYLTAFAAFIEKQNR